MLLGLRDDTVLVDGRFIMVRKECVLILDLHWEA